MSIAIDIAEYSNKQHKLIRSICEPLERHFGLDYMGFQSVNKQGHYWGISNLPEMALHVAQQQYYMDSPIIIDPDKLSSATLHTNYLTYIPYYHRFTHSAADKFGLKNLVVYIMKHPEHVEIFTFATSHRINVYANSFLFNTSLINNFVKFFHCRTEFLRKNISEDFLDLVALKENDFICAESPEYLNMSNAVMDDFLQEVNIAGIQRSDFTRREAQCIQAYIEGLTAQQTADLYQISKRTVEDYLNNIKSKLNIEKKAQILHSLIKHDLLKYFKT